MEGFRPQWYIDQMTDRSREAVLRAEIDRLKRANLILEQIVRNSGIDPARWSA